MKPLPIGLLIAVNVANKGHRDRLKYGQSGIPASTETAQRAPMGSPSQPVGGAGEGTQQVEAGEPSRPEQEIAAPDRVLDPGSALRSPTPASNPVT